MPVVNRTALEIKKVIEKIKTVEQSLLSMNARGSKSFHIKTISSAIRKLCSCVIDLRLILLPLVASTQDMQNELDDDISDIIAINFDLIEFDDFIVYEITVPVIIPKTKSLISKNLWNCSFKAAYKHFCERHGIKIQRIGNPVVIFENQFINETQGNGLKDTDNYEVSDLLNMLQYYFISDDSTATLAVRNITGAPKNQTKIYIISEENLKDWLLNCY